MGKNTRRIAVMLAALALAGCMPPPTVTVQRCPAIPPTDELECTACPPYPWGAKPEQIEVLENRYDESKAVYLECKALADACLRRERVWAETWERCGE